MATGELPRPPGLARFFERVVRQALGDLRLGGPTEGAYLAALLARFARTDELYAIRDAAGRPLDSVAGLLIEAERAWDFRAPDFDPFRERRVRQHVGDYALFMTGLFREHVERRAGAAYYIRQGQRASRKSSWTSSALSFDTAPNAASIHRSSSSAIVSSLRSTAPSRVVSISPIDIHASILLCQSAELTNSR